LKNLIIDAADVRHATAERAISDAKDAGVIFRDGSNYSWTEQ
jgi:hypothetical protein